MTSELSAWHEVLDEYERVLDRCAADFARAVDGEVVRCEPSGFRAPTSSMPAECAARATVLQQRTDELIDVVAAATQEVAPQRAATRPVRTVAASTFDRRV